MGESQGIAVGAALSAFSGASQHNRLMRLDFPFKDGPPAILLPNKLVAHEEVSRETKASILGLNGEHATAILANAPAALELFPGSAYGKGRLKVVDGSGR